MIDTWFVFWKRIAYPLKRSRRLFCFNFYIIFILGMKIQAKHFYTFLAIRRSRTGKIWAMELFPALGQIVYHCHSGRQRFDCESQTTSRRTAPGHLLTLDPSVCSHVSSPDLCAWPMPYPAHLCFLSPILGIALSLVDAMVWFGSSWGFLLSWVAMGTASNCMSLSAARPWWGLQGTVAMALLLPPPPCSRVPGASLPVWPVSPCPRAVLWALTKAAALTGLHLPSLVCSPFFLSRSSSSHSLAPLLSKHIPTKVAFASVSGCKGCGHAAVTWSCCSDMAAAAPDLAFCLLHLLAFSSGTSQFYSIPCHSQPDLP